MELLWTDFLNSIWRDWRGTGKPTRDRLGDPGWQASFLNRWHLETELPAVGEDLKRLIELRTFLGQLTEKISTGGPILEEDAAVLNGFLRQSPVIRRVVKKDEGWDWEFQSTRRNWDQVIEAIVTSFVNTMIDGDASRIRMCDNRDCLWVFYDSTKNRSKRYCDEKACGNLMKVRKFRERHKNEDQQE